jgi:polyisoprenoid-binding protein YceI
MHKVFGTLSLAAVFAVFGCSGGTTTAPSGTHSAPAATDGHAKPVATNGNPKPVATDGNAKPVSTEGSAKPVASSGGAITPENSKIEFLGAAPDHQHDGGFKKFSGSLKPSDGDITKATLNVEIDLNSMWTDDDDKKKALTPHLKSPDFFDTTKYPTAKFVSKEIKAEKKDDNTHVITGDLTLHGETKAVTIPVKVTTTDDAVKLDGQFTIDRTDFGIGKKFDATKIKNDVTIKLAVKAAPK